MTDSSHQPTHMTKMPTAARASFFGSRATWNVRNSSVHAQYVRASPSGVPMRSSAMPSSLCQSAPVGGPYGAGIIAGGGRKAIGRGSRLRLSGTAKPQAARSEDEPDAGVEPVQEPDRLALPVRLEVA